MSKHFLESMDYFHVYIYKYRYAHVVEDVNFCLILKWPPWCHITFFPKKCIIYETPSPPTVLDMLYLRKKSVLYPCLFNKILCINCFSGEQEIKTSLMHFMFKIKISSMRVGSRILNGSISILMELILKCIIRKPW